MAAILSKTIWNPDKNIHILNGLVYVQEFPSDSHPETRWEVASPELRNWVGTGKRMFPNVWDATFPRKYLVPGKWHLGTQTLNFWSPLYFDTTLFLNFSLPMIFWTTGNCNPGVTGQRCEMCLPQHYGFSTEGCKACECDPTGSLNLQCDLLTGQCECRDKVSQSRKIYVQGLGDGTVCVVINQLWDEVTMGWSNSQFYS